MAEFNPLNIVDDEPIASGGAAIKTAAFDPLKIIDDEPINPNKEEISPAPKEAGGVFKRTKPEPKTTQERLDLGAKVFEGYSFTPFSNFSKNLFKSKPEEGMARDMNIYAISEATKLSRKDVQDHYDEISRMHEITGMKPDLNNKEYIQGLMDIGLLGAGGEMGALASAGEWAKAGEMGWKLFKGVGTFTVLDKAFPVEKYFSQDTSDTTKTWARLADFTIKGILSGGLAESTPRFSELKNMFFSKKLNIPQSVNITPEQLAAIGQHENGEDVFKALGIEGRHQEAAKNLNQTINVPAQKIMDLAQEPYWDKVKSLFGVTAEEKPYVINKPFDLSFGKDDKATAGKLRGEFSGLKNEQIARGNQLAERIKKLVPDEKERSGMFWYKAARGNTDILTEMLNVPEMERYHEQIRSALNLSPKALKALEMTEKYYQEAGKVSQEVGTIKNITENYQNRIYKPEPPKDFVKTEVKAGIKQTTSHAKARVFDTEFEAVMAGKEFATTDIANALAIHNEEMARVNASRKMADTMVERGLGAWHKPDNIPDDWVQVGNMRKSVPIRDSEGNAVVGEEGNQIVSQSIFTAPKGIAKGLEAITDPNFIKKVDTLRGLQRYQGLVKTVDLSMSFFHHFSMAAQIMYQGGVRTLLTAGTMSKQMAMPVFEELETDFVQHTGMTSKVEYTQDILRNLVEKNPDIFSKVENLPGVKQYLNQSDKNAEFLFGRLQRYLKVSDYGSKISEWVAKNPEATNAQVKAAKIGFAKQINAVYGGLNWEAMGVTKSQLSLLRLGLLAPDWTISNVALLKYAIGEKGTAGSSSRAHILRALVGGLMATEAMNKIATGHFTNENPKGHELEVQVAPDVYVSLLRGGIGDITKFVSMVNESGGAGAIRFSQGKLSPFARTGVGLLAAPMGALDYTGHRIIRRDAGAITGTYDILKYTLAGVGPVPFSLGTLPKYLTDKTIEKTAAGALAVGTGIGRYSKPSRTKKRAVTPKEDIDRLFKEMFKKHD